MNMTGGDCPTRNGLIGDQEEFGTSSRSGEITDHEAEFPEELARRVIQLFCPLGGMVLDPFVGTGTTAVVADRLGRGFIGIDIDPQNVSMAQERLRPTKRMSQTQ